MEVYVELAFSENFILDALLVFLAVKCARAQTGALRLCLAAALGAAEAVLFPLFSLPLWAAYAVKLLGGLLLPLVAVKRGSFRTHLFAALAFFALTFALGGMLAAVYSFFGVETAEEGGYLVESAPVGLVFGLAGCFSVAVFFLSRSFYRYRKLKRSLFAVELTHAGRTARLKGLADTGNALVFRGKPVSVLSPPAALLLFGRETAPLGRIRIESVGGARESPVFACERVVLGNRVFSDALFTVGDVRSKEYQIVLHTFYLEEDHEALTGPANVAAEDKRGKRHPLSLRQRGASASPVARRRE